MSTYVIGDIHNSIDKLNNMLEQIRPTLDDRLYFLGDLFDRGADNPDPVGVYFKITGLACNVTWICGNHDKLLADYIFQYFGLPDRKRKKLIPYSYNSFDIMKDRLVKVDMINLADIIMNLPLQVEIEVNSVKYLLAHAMTFDPSAGKQDDKAYLEGIGDMQAFWEYGVEGYVSLVGHTDSANQRYNSQGKYSDEESNSIWLNDRGNVYMMDCGCGLPGGRLAAICLDTGEKYYSATNEMEESDT